MSIYDKIRLATPAQLKEIKRKLLETRIKTGEIEITASPLPANPHCFSPVERIELDYRAEFGND